MKTEIDELLEATRNIEGGIVDRAKRQLEMQNFIFYYLTHRLNYWGDYVDVYNGAAS